LIRIKSRPCEGETDPPEHPPTRLNGSAPWRTAALLRSSSRGLPLRYVDEFGAARLRVTAAGNIGIRNSIWMRFGRRPYPAATGRLWRCVAPSREPRICGHGMTMWREARGSLPQVQWPQTAAGEECRRPPLRSLGVWLCFRAVRLLVGKRRQIPFRYSIRSLRWASSRFSLNCVL